MSGAFDLSGRAAVVTGAAMGIGRGIAEAYAAAGASVLLVDRDEHVRDVAGAIPGRTAALVADVTDPDAPARAVAACRDAFGSLDVLVNNAGRYPMAPLHEITRSLIDDVLTLNLAAPLRMIQAVAEAMGGGGSIINIASLDGIRPSMKGLTTYGASKAGLIATTKHLALELAEQRIRVNAIVPGGIRTEGADALSGAGTMTEAERDAMFAAFDAKIPMGRMGVPADLAGPAVFLAGPASAYVTGSVLIVDGGLLLTS